MLKYQIYNYISSNLLSKKDKEQFTSCLGLLLTTRQTTKIRNATENNMSTNIKLSKALIPEIIQSGRFIGKPLGALSKTEDYN